MVVNVNVPQKKWGKGVWRENSNSCSHKNISAFTDGPLTDKKRAGFSKRKKEKEKENKKKGGANLK